MSSDYKEIEVKFLIKEPATVELSLNKLGARLLQPRFKEVNFRLDTQDKRIAANSQVLRLRQDSKQWLTFKGPGTFVDGVKIREEIEFEISDIQAARALLEALDFHIYMTYEKFRTVYTLGEIKIMVDELPFGDFIEIEGSDVPSLKLCAKNLKLSWEKKIENGYMDIHKKLCATLGIKTGDLIFDDLTWDKNSFKLLNIYPADL
jgi:adenylate cyclase class 2